MKKTYIVKNIKDSLEVWYDFANIEHLSGISIALQNRANKGYHTVGECVAIRTDTSQLLVSFETVSVNGEGYINVYSTDFNSSGFATNYNLEYWISLTGRNMTQVVTWVLWTLNQIRG